MKAQNQSPSHSNLVRAVAALPEHDAWGLAESIAKLGGEIKLLDGVVNAGQMAVLVEAEKGLDACNGALSSVRGFIEGLSANSGVGHANRNAVAAAVALLVLAGETLGSKELSRLATQVRTGSEGLLNGPASALDSLARIAEQAGLVKRAAKAAHA